ncbi:MAG: hypothetical protein GF317_02760 [Candidatus Lokiarchaeota archaeon]|nr:hypothetical protein [Candidatus Lokiarchaeota archaeon]MBD3198827.1 hypothetical protein [Candidatus Lokiarchaeota archaeon]
MSFTEREKRIINNEMSKLKNEISLKFFTDYIKDEEGNKIRKCMSCNGIATLLSALAQSSKGKLAVEEFSTELDSEDSNNYKIDKIPTILFLDKKGKEIIRYTAIPDGNELVPFIKTLQIYSGKSPFYKDQIKSNLNKIDKSDIKLFITQTCPYCPQVLPIATLFAIVAKGKISLDIVDINANPDIAQRYNVSGVPFTLINEKESISGMFTPQDLLDKLTKGQRDFGGMYA